VEVYDAAEHDQREYKGASPSEVRVGTIVAEAEMAKLERNDIPMSGVERLNR